VTHFVGIVCIALVLEGLLMVIKYSQLELAGNLTYPVAIIASAALLLTALGLFLRFTENLDAQAVALHAHANPLEDEGFTILELVEIAGADGGVVFQNATMQDAQLVVAVRFQGDAFC